MMLYIRADANEKIGTGHIMRCLSIAEEYRRQNGEVIFLTADECAGDLIEKKGFSYICLNSVWNNLERELDVMVGIIEEKRIPLLLVDSYFVTERYLSTLRKYTRIAYMDDLDQFIYPVDLLINYNIYAEQLDYPQRYRDAGVKAKFALGCSYAPLREEFRGRERSISQRVQKVLITTGGTDIYDVTGHLFEHLSGQPWFSELEFEVIVGRFNRHGDELIHRWEKQDNIHFHRNIADIADYMLASDVAVTAGGSTVYELMACGTPAMVYTLADNQFAIARAVSGMGLMPWAGDVREDMESCCRSLVRVLNEYIGDYGRRKQVSRRMQDLVDGCGSRRLVSALEEWKSE